MRQLSENYDLEYSQPIMRRLRCSVKWGVINPIAAENANASATDKAPFSNIEGLTLFNSVPNTNYGTFEPNLWDLTGAMKLIPTDNNYGDIGLISSSTSNENGLFDSIVPPELNITFNIPINVSGLIITFAQYNKEFAEEFDLIVHFEDTTQTVVSIDGNTIFAPTVPLNFESVVAVDIIVKKWNLGNRRARIGGIEFGIYKIYDETTMIDAVENKQLNQVSTELPISTFNITVVDKEDLFNIDNETGITPFLTQRQPIEITYQQEVDGGWETIQGGVYYLKEWTDNGNREQYVLMAEDLLGFMDETYYGGTYFPLGQSVRNEVERVLQSAFPITSGLNGKWDLSHIPEILLYAPIPTKINGKYISHKEALQMLLQYANCIVTFNEFGHIVPKPAHYIVDSQTSTSNDYIVPLSKVFDTPPKAKLKSTLKSVESVFREQTVLSDMVEVYKIELTDVIANREYIFEHTLNNTLVAVDNTQTMVSVTDFLDNTVANYTAEKNSYCTILKFDTDGDYKISIGSKPITQYKTSINIFNTADSNYLNGETVLIDNPLVSTKEVAQSMANNFMKELVSREEYQISMKRDLRPEVGDVIEVQKMLLNTGLPLTNIPVRVVGIKRSIISAKQELRTRKIVVTEE